MSDHYLYGPFNKKLKKREIWRIRTTSKVAAAQLEPKDVPGSPYLAYRNDRGDENVDLQFMTNVAPRKRANAVATGPDEAEWGYDQLKDGLLPIHILRVSDDEGKPIKYGDPDSV